MGAAVVRGPAGLALDRNRRLVTVNDERVPVDGYRWGIDTFVDGVTRLAYEDLAAASARE